MKYNWKGLIITCLTLYFIGDPLHQLLLGGSNHFFDLVSSKTDLLLTCSSLLSFSLYGLLAYTFLYFFYPSKNYVALFVGLLLSLGLPIGLRFVIEEIVYQLLFGFDNYSDGVSVGFYISDNFFYAFRYTLFGAMFYFIVLSISKEKREKDLVIANQKMELSLLHSQINPHFLLNSLNNIYSLVYRRSDQALEALDLLSGMLRYVLYEKRVMISVEEEMTYIRQFVSLQSLRYDYPVAVILQVAPEVASINIPQFLLVPLIENGFKHGDLKDQDDPLKFEIFKHDKWLHIVVGNRKNKSQKDEKQGIGLENIQKRLTLLYPQNHEFKVQEDQQHFKIELQLPLP